MPPLEEDYLFQDAVVWRRTGTDPYGEPLVADPEEIIVRWEEGTGEVRTAAGQTVTFDTKAWVEEDIPIGSTMWEGKLVDWYGTGSGGTDSELMQVVKMTRIPDDKGRNTRRCAHLKRFRHDPAEDD